MRCTIVRSTGDTGGRPGSVTFRPTELLPIGGDITVALLFCERCQPAWYVRHIPIDSASWNAADWRRGDGFRCPGRRGRVSWHNHGPTWRPSYSHGESRD
jgi:hypothetical protein